MKKAIGPAAPVIVRSKAEAGVLNWRLPEEEQVQSGSYAPRDRRCANCQDGMGCISKKDFDRSLDVQLPETINAKEMYAHRPLWIPFYGLYLESYQVTPKRNY